MHAIVTRKLGRPHFRFMTLKGLDACTSPDAPKLHTAAATTKRCQYRGAIPRKYCKSVITTVERGDVSSILDVPKLVVAIPMNCKHMGVTRTKDC